MKFKDGKTISAYVRSKLHSAYITIAEIARMLLQFTTIQVRKSVILACI